LLEKDKASESASFIKQKVLNWIELQDLQYHAKIIKMLLDSPSANQDASTVQDSQQDEVRQSPSPFAVWSEPPQLMYPAELLSLLDLQKFHIYMCELVETVRERIDKRREEEAKRKAEKQ
jgi:hypothetical protein